MGLWKLEWSLVAAAVTRNLQNYVRSLIKSFSSFAGEPDFSQKHPLETKWTLWFDNPNGKQKQAQWGQTLRAVYTFDTVEDFWW